MIYTLKRHELDNSMIQAITKLGDNREYLAFILHEDMLSENITSLLDRDDYVDIAFEPIFWRENK